MAEVVKKPKTSLSLVHGEYVRYGDDEDAYIGVCKDCDTGELKLKIVDNPVVNIWVTKPEFRVHTHKRSGHLSRNSTSTQHGISDVVRQSGMR